MQGPRDSSHVDLRLSGIQSSSLSVPPTVHGTAGDIFSCRVEVTCNHQADSASYEINGGESVPLECGLRHRGGCREPQGVILLAPRSLVDPPTVRAPSECGAECRNETHASRQRIPSIQPRNAVSDDSCGGCSIKRSVFELSELRGCRSHSFPCGSST